MNGKDTVLHARVFLACTIALASIASSEIGAQTSTFSYSLRLQETARVPFGLLDFGVGAYTQFERLSDGSVIVGPLKRGSESATLRLSPDLSKVSRFTRRGFGPGETSGFFAMAAAGDGGIVISSMELGRTQLISKTGIETGSAAALSMPDGVAVCRGRMLLSGVGGTERGALPGVFVSIPGSKERQLLHSLRTGTTQRHSVFFNQQLSVRKDVMIAAIPNRAELAVSNEGCTSVRRVPIRLPWFESWDVMPQSVPWVSAAKPTIKAVRWYSDSIAILFATRANPAARYVRASPGSPPPPPKGRVPFVQALLIAVNPYSGAVLAELEVPLYSWKFMSENELVAHLEGDVQTSVVHRLVVSRKMR